MNVIVKHPGHPAALTEAPDPVEPVDVESGNLAPVDIDPVDIAPVDIVGARIPHVAIHVFAQSEVFAERWRQAARDRRLAAATTALHQGGLQGAVALYRAGSAPDLVPDLVIVESGAGEDELCFQLDALADLCRPETRVIVIGRQNDIQLYRKMLAMGVSAYLVAPVGVAAMIAAIADIYAAPESAGTGRIAAVLGAKGGVGASTIAQALALGLSARRGADALLVDLDTAFGAAGLDGDPETGQGLAELIRDPERIDAEMLDRLCVRRGANLALLGAGPGLDAGHEIDAPAVERVLHVAAAHFRRVVLDVPHLWGDWVERLLVAVDDVIVVSTPELASLRNAAAVIGRARALRPNDRAPQLVLNQVGMPRRQEITSREIAKVLEIEPALSVPFDARTFSMAAAGGRMVAETARRRPIARGLKGLAGLVDRDERPAEARQPRRWWSRRPRAERG